jgi:hypothetical protein
MDYRAGCCYRHRPRRPPLPPASGELGTQATGLCAKRTFCPLFFTPNSGVELRWASQTGKSVFLACDSAAPAGIGRIRNTGHRPVRQTAEWNSAGRTDPEVCVPPLVAGPSCSKHSSIVK